MGIIIAFDLTNRESFENLTTWLQNLKGEADDNVVKVIVGNKSDLKREISSEELQETAVKHQLFFFETSAKSGQGINEVFEYMAKEIYKKFLSGTKDSILTDPTINVDTNRKTLGTTNKKRNEGCCK
mmetsp:Transcript_4965/g.4169  ORF Transcript_4965/g.4169 Transcript_4965/m.4169 type:complete len:127 (+) Transcript_4965:295-675(+)